MGLGSGIRDPGSGKNLFRIPDPGVKKAPDPGSGSATLTETLQCKRFNEHGHWLTVGVYLTYFDLDLDAIFSKICTI
jgi:hypothetical protein